jgi:hypothetical protein
MNSLDLRSRSRTARRLACGLVLGLVLLASPAAAQVVLDIDIPLSFDAPESWAMKRIASLSLYTGMGVPRAMKPGSLELGLEGLWIPAVSEEKATVGFNGIKTEDVNRLSAFGRPRLLVGLPAKWSLDLSWVPPWGRIRGIEPDLLAVGIARPLWEGERSRIGVRLYGQHGSIRGDITCTRKQAAAGPDLEANPYQCEEPSDDTLSIDSESLELSAALPWGDPSRWDPYVALSVNRMDIDLQVHALYSGILDTTHGFTDGWTWAAMGGTRYRTGERWELAGELFVSPLGVIRPPVTSAQTENLTHFRVSASYRIR